MMIKTFMSLLVHAQDNDGKDDDYDDNNNNDDVAPCCCCFPVRLPQRDLRA